MSKKILLLGGSRYALPVIEAAHNLDCKVITCDYLPDNIAHKYSDGYENVSIIEKEEVLRVAEKNKIDGILSFACDPGVVTAAYVAEKMGIPSCGSYESVSILQNKGKFRQFLRDHGFSVPWSFGYTELSDALDDEDKFAYPLIVKPTDSAGSKGVSRVGGKDELKKAIMNALDNSHCHQFIIEKFLENVGCPSDSECFSIDGQLRFTSFSAQKFDKQSANPYTPSGFTWLPDISADNQNKIKGELQRLINLLGMRTSLYNVESRQCVDGEAYLMEVSPRGGGNRLAEMLKKATGTDLIECAVKASLGEEINNQFDETVYGNWAEIILHGRKQGSYRGISFTKDIRDNLVEEDIWIRPGDLIEPFTGANMTIGTLVMNFSNKSMMQEIMEDPYKYIEIVTEG